MEETFTEVYEKKIWGSNDNTEYNGSSGDGSRIYFNKDTYVIFIKKFINDNNIKNVVDLGCGDFLCGDLIYDDLNVEYTGYDTYKKIVDYNNKKYENDYSINFKHLDFYTYRDQIKSADLCIIKDVIQHWKLEEIYTFLDYIVASKKFKYILICNCGYQQSDNTNIETGGWRPLSCDFFPLKKYDAIKKYNYISKEVSVIYL